MAKANPGGGKDYGSSEPTAPGEGYETQGGDESKDPEARLQERQVKLLQMKAAEKRLQDEISRLTAHNATYKAWASQVGPAAVADVNTSRAELAKFVESGMKALDDKTRDHIKKTRQKVDHDIEEATTKYTKALEETKDRRAAVAVGQTHSSTAAEAYAKAKALTARVKQATSDLLAVRQKIEALVKADKFTEAGFWLFELEAQLAAAPNLDRALAALSEAWRDLEHAHTEVAAAEDALTEAVAKEAAAKKALDDATKNRVTTITDALAEPASPKTAAA